MFTPAATDTAYVILTVVGWTNGNGWLGLKVGGKEIGGQGGRRRGRRDAQAQSYQFKNYKRSAV